VHGMAAIPYAELRGQRRGVRASSPAVDPAGARDQAHAVPHVGDSPIVRASFGPRTRGEERRASSSSRRAATSKANIEWPNRWKRPAYTSVYGLVGIEDGTRRPALGRARPSRKASAGTSTSAPATTYRPREALRRPWPVHVPTTTSAPTSHTSSTDSRATAALLDHPRSCSHSLRPRMTEVDPHEEPRAAAERGGKAAVSDQELKQPRRPPT